MSGEKILVTGADLAPEACKMLSQYEIIYTGKTPSQEDIIDHCRRYNPSAIIVRYNGVSDAAMSAAPALKVIAKHGSGIDTIDVTAAKARNIQVRAALGVNAAAVAEHTLALLLACAKSIPGQNTRTHQGHWDKATHKSLELGGLRIGLIGLGAIGLRFARMAHALDMHVMGYDPYATDLPSYIQSVTLDNLWHEADVLSLHCPLTEQNQHLLNHQTLAQCKPGVIVVNTARGGLINELALLEALNSGQVLCAGLDSFEVEPMRPKHPFHHHPNIILSPHIAGVTSATYVKMGIAAANNILAVLKQTCSTTC